MFYENYRIVRKQAIYLSSKANQLIDKFKAKGMARDEIIAAIELLAEDKSQSQPPEDVIKMALTILKNKENYG